MANSAQQGTIFGHPRGLVVLFFTEMWERFSYYGMRGLLIVYLTQHFLFSDERSSLLYGAYTALVFVMTIVGGVLADRYLGARKAVTFGAILLTLGHFGMSSEGDGSKQMLQYAGAEYQITLDARGGDARQMIASGQGSSYISSYVSFTETSMDIAEPEALGLPASIPRDQITMSVVRIIGGTPSQSFRRHFFLKSPRNQFSVLHMWRDVISFIPFTRWQACE